MFVIEENCLTALNCLIIKFEGAADTILFKKGNSKLVTYIYLKHLYIHVNNNTD